MVDFSVPPDGSAASSSASSSSTYHTCRTTIPQSADPSRNCEQHSASEAALKTNVPPIDPLQEQERPCIPYSFDPTSSPPPEDATSSCTDTYLSSLSDDDNDDVTTPENNSAASTTTTSLLSSLAEFIAAAREHEENKNKNKNDHKHDNDRDHELHHKQREILLHLSALEGRLGENKREREAMKGAVAVARREGRWQLAERLVRVWAILVVRGGTMRRLRGELRGLARRAGVGLVEVEVVEVGEVVGWVEEEEGREGVVTEEEGWGEMEDGGWQQVEAEGDVQRERVIEWLDRVPEPSEEDDALVD